MTEQATGTPHISTGTTRRAREAQVLPRFLSCLLRLDGVLVAILSLGVLLLGLRSVADPDISWHLRNAAYLVRAHSWIRQDMYAYTTLGMPWIDHEWLAELPFYAAFRAWGTNGLSLLTLLLIESIILGTFMLARKAANSTKAAWVVVMAGTFLCTISFGPRTLLFGWVCLIGELLLIDRFERHRVAAKREKMLWLLPPLFLVWINLHGSWLIGTTLLLVYILCGCVSMSAGALEQRRWNRAELRTLCAIFGSSVAALFINPYGWELVAYPFDLAFRQKLNVAHIQEWQPLDLQSARGRILLTLLAFSFVAQLVRRRRWAPYQVAFVLIGTFAAFTHARFLFLAAILALPLLARDIPWPRTEQPGKPQLFLHAALLLLLLVSGTRLARARAASVREAEGYPVKALPFLRTWHPEGRVFNDFLWGGYLELYAPNVPVFIDSRVDIFERSGVLRDYIDVIDLKNSLAVLNKDGIRYVLFSRDSSLAYFLEQSPAWKIDYQDKTTILFERNDLPRAAR